MTAQDASASELPSSVPPGREAARAEGRARRRAVPRQSHAELVVPERDPLAILDAQARDRLPDLVALRTDRLAQSPFTYLRGTAAVMAHDLATTPASGIDVVLCGDAHLANFGLFASPERDLLFDVNDFDEAGTGPWEWDVKRLAASAVVAGRHRGWPVSAVGGASEAAVRGYRTSVRHLADLSALDRFYAKTDAGDLLQASTTAFRPILTTAVAHAQHRTSDGLVRKITIAGDDGTLRIVEDPPIIHHVDAAAVGPVLDLYDAYRSTVRSDVAHLLRQFRPVDVARRVVGVGSVGTRCFVVLLQGPAGEPLFMQIKEALPSALSTYGGRPTSAALSGAPKGPGFEGWRVVTCQRILQASSDPFLGWISVDGRDYYCRQFRDQKGSFDLATMTSAQFSQYSELCGRALGRAHAQSPGALAIASYLGASTRFDVAVTAWAQRYADVVDADHAALVRRTGRDRGAPSEG